MLSSLLLLYVPSHPCAGRRQLKGLLVLISWVCMCVIGCGVKLKDEPRNGLSHLLSMIRVCEKGGSLLRCVACCCDIYHEP